MMNILRLSLILCFTGGLTFSAFAKDSLSERLVGTWQSLSRTANAWETTFNADGSYVSTADMRLTTGDNLSEKGKWRLEGDQLFLTPDSHTKPSDRPYATVSFDENTRAYGRGGGGAILRLEDESNSWKWDNGDQKVVQTGNYARLNLEDFVCDEEVALMQQEAKAAAIVAQRSSRSVNSQPDPVVPATTMQQSVVYSVVVEDSFLNCIDTSSGVMVGKTYFVGPIAQGPSVNGNRCTVVTGDSTMGKRGTVYELPSFNVVSIFHVSP